VLWDTATRTQLGRLGRSVDNVAFSHDGKTLATGDFDGNAVLWGTATRTRLGQLSAGSPDENVAFTPNGSMAFSADGKTLASVDAKGDVVLWDTATRSQLGQLSGDGYQIDSVAFSPDGKTLVSGDEHGNVALVPSLYWAGSFGQVQKILCTEVRANLTRAQWAQYVPGEPYQAICPGNP
jgi:WD40 repeat protein